VRKVSLPALPAYIASAANTASLQNTILVPWQSGKPLTWGVTMVHTLADSYMSQTSRSADAAAEVAASRKSTRPKYADLLQSHLFQPIAVKTSDFMDYFIAILITDLCRKIT